MPAHRPSDPRLSDHRPSPVLGALLLAAGLSLLPTLPGTPASAFLTLPAAAEAPARGAAPSATAPSSPLQPPVAERRPKTTELHGVALVDP